MNDGAARAFALAFLLVLAIGISGLVVAFYLKWRLSRPPSFEENVFDEILKLFGICLLLVITSVCATMVFRGSNAAFTSGYLLWLGASGIVFFLVAAAGLIVGRWTKSRGPAGWSSTTWLAVGLLLAAFSPLNAALNAVIGPEDIPYEYVRAVVHGFGYPINLLTMVADPGYLFWTVRSEIEARIVNHFEMADFYAPIFFVMAAWSFMVNASRKLKRS